MDVEKARAIYDDDDYEDIEDKHDLVEGIRILGKYLPEGEKYGYSFEYDQLYFLSFQETVARMTEEDVRTMFGLGWFESEESWSLVS